MEIFSFEIENYEGDSNEESASAFIVSTCQLLPKPSSLVVSDHMRDLIMSPCPANKVYEIRCGSSAEFYIRPLNTCIDDVDYLHVRADELAFSGNIPVLPEDVSGLADTIICGKIEPCPGYPGFIRLLLLGEMKYNWKYKYYEFNHTPHANRYLTIDTVDSGGVSNYKLGTRCLLPSIVSGPAMKCQPREGHDAGFDAVKSMWCPQWPNEAQKWITRRRKFGWPMIDTISEVVQNGCHIVYVQHRACREDKQQSRLSFSLAEVTLLQSWTQVQQIVYHLFRFFSKRVLIQKDCRKEDEVLCTYHLKTLMLWTCEEMPQEWWNTASVITICHEMLLKLSEWLRKRRFPNYFIPEANLFHEHLSITMLDKTERRLNEFRNLRVLCDWFVNNYILSFITRFFSPMTTFQVMPHFANFMLPLFDAWKASESNSIDTLFHYTLLYFHQNSRYLIKAGSSSGLRPILQNLLALRCGKFSKTGKLPSIPAQQKISCFSYYDILLSILHSGFGLECGEISWESSLIVELIEVISMKPKFIKSQYHNFPKTYKEHIELCNAQSSESHDSLYQSSECRFQFLCAQGLMENLTGSNSGSEFELVSFMCKEYLRKALAYDHSQLEGFAPAALVYFAALHFASSEYQEAMPLCLTVLSSKTLYKDYYYTLNAGCLFFVDDVARIVGLYVLHLKMKKICFQYINKRLYIDLRISPEMFAYYLAVLYADGPSTVIVFNHELPDTAFPMDDYLKAVLKLNCRSILGNATKQTVYRRRATCRMAKLSRTDNPIKETVIIELLLEYALENMTSFYNVIRRDLGMQCNTDDCYRALYLYKCRKYDEVQHLCKQIILDESDLQSNMRRLALANVLLLPPLDSFFDEDVQCLRGFQILFCYLSHLREGERISECIKNPTLANWHCTCSYCMNILSVRHCMNTPPKNDISCHLQRNCAIEYVNVIGGHFLARYLKVRCCIDCNLPHSEALTEFAAHKIHRPFERIIRGFILQKLRVI